MCSVRTPPEVHSHTIPVGAKNHLNSSLPGSGGRIGAAFVGDMHAFVEPQGHAIGQRDRIKKSDTKSGLRPFYPFSIRKKNKINQVNIIIYIHTYIHTFPHCIPVFTPCSDQTLAHTAFTKAANFSSTPVPVFSAASLIQPFGRATGAIG